MDGWIYPALDRLHSLGYLDTAFLGIRPRMWLLSIAHMLEQRADRIDADQNDDGARSIYLAVLWELRPDIDNATELNHPSDQLESVQPSSGANDHRRLRTAVRERLQLHGFQRGGRSGTIYALLSRRV
jgi:hypothetical protein